ncbi:MAG: hypothetical protein ACTHNQ_02665 [Microbacterium sp.]|uniref:hypothetical protein n=1 Tax=Microbacterium sp. TaxID=51671 RepID=UPI003F805EA1
MVRKPEAGSSSRDDGIPPDDADGRSRALADFFGTTSVSTAPVVQQQEDGDRQDRLASFFEEPASRQPGPRRTSAVAPTSTPAEVGVAPRKKEKSARAVKVVGAGSPLQGHFASTPRGVRAWRKGVWWAIGSSVVLVGALVGAAAYVAQITAAQEAELAAAIADVEEAADDAGPPVSAMDAAYADYETKAAAARGAAESAGAALSAVGGMADQPTLDAATSAQGALVALLDSAVLPEHPEEYSPPRAETIDDVTEAKAAVAQAHRYVTAVEDATAQVIAATAALAQQATVLADAQRALGASLPATAESINEQNPRALESFRDAVTNAAAAVGAAQAAGGSGDAELQAYAAAVAALRADQLRAEEAASRRVPPANPAPAPQPTPEPAPTPTPEPTTEPVVPPTP